MGKKCQWRRFGTSVSVRGSSFSTSSSCSSFCSDCFFSQRRSSVTTSSEAASCWTRCDWDLVLSCSQKPLGDGVTLVLIIRAWAWAHAWACAWAFVRLGLGFCPTWACAVSLTNKIVYLQLRSILLVCYSLTVLSELLHFPALPFFNFCNFSSAAVLPYYNSFS